MSISARRPFRRVGPPGVIDDPCFAFGSLVLEAEFQSEERDQDEAASAGTAANDTRAAVPTMAPVRAVTESFIVAIALDYGIMAMRWKVHHIEKVVGLRQHERLQ